MLLRTCQKLGAAGSIPAASIRLARLDSPRINALARWVALLLPGR